MHKVRNRNACGHDKNEEYYYEKSELGEKSRNRMRDEAVKKIVLLREKGKSA